MWQCLIFYPYMHYATYIMLQPRVIDHNYAKMVNFNIGNFPIQYNNLHVDLHINYYWTCTCIISYIINMLTSVQDSVDYFNVTGIIPCSVLAAGTIIINRFLLRSIVVSWNYRIYQEIYTSLYFCESAKLKNLRKYKYLRILNSKPRPCITSTVQLRVHVVYIFLRKKFCDWRKFRRGADWYSDT